VNCEVQYEQMTSFRLVSPFPERELEKFWRWCEENRSAMMDDGAPQDFEALKAKNARDLKNGALTYGVLAADGRCVGAVWGESAGDSIYYGHLVFERDWFTPSEKLAATKDALGKMFAAGARKIVWMAYPDNRPFLIFLLKLGATTEGYIRKGTRKAGNVADFLLLATFPEDMQ
jgi:RimJ/RimL family protein N-acetyltransferase